VNGPFVGAQVASTTMRVSLVKRFALLWLAEFWVAATMLYSRSISIKLRPVIAGNGLSGCIDG
jgi:hypothetical protein